VIFGQPVDLLRWDLIADDVRQFFVGEGFALESRHAALPVRPVGPSNWPVFFSQSNSIVAKARVYSKASCASGRCEVVSVASRSAAPRSLLWGISAVALEEAILLAAVQRRLFVSSISTLTGVQSKAGGALFLYGG